MAFFNLNFKTHTIKNFSCESFKKYINFLGEVIFKENMCNTL